MSTSASDQWELDTIDSMIIDKGLRIQKLYFDLELDMMLIVLNNRRVLKRNLSHYPTLSKASAKELQAYKIGVMGVHWEKLDEDLGLKGFLKEEMLKAVEKEILIA